MIEIDDDGDRRSRRDDFTDFDELLGDQSRPIGERSVASVMLFSQRRDLRVDGRDARARGIDFFRPGAGVQLRQDFVGGPDAALRAR